jgi:hypothetical protein
MIEETARGRNQDMTFVRENDLGFGILADGRVRDEMIEKYMILLGTAHDMPYLKRVIS